MYPIGLVSILNDISNVLQKISGFHGNLQRVHLGCETVQHTGLRRAVGTPGERGGGTEVGVVSVQKGPPLDRRAPHQPTPAAGRGVDLLLGLGPVVAVGQVDQRGAAVVLQGAGHGLQRAAERLDAQLVLCRRAAER